MTIRTKLSLSVGLLLLVSTGLLGAGVLAVSDSFARKDAQARLAVIESSLRQSAEEALLQKDSLQLVSALKSFLAQYPVLAYARVLWEARGRSRAIALGRAPERDAGEVRVLEAVDPADPSRRARLELGINRSALYQDLGRQRRRLGKILLGVSLLTLLLGVAFSLWLARSLTAPLHSLVALAMEIGAGKLGGRLAWNSRDEIGALVRVFNQMSGRLEELAEAKKTFVSSVTHELRSPLGAIESFLHLIAGKLKEGAGEGEIAQCREYLGRIQANVSRLGGFIGDLLDVAKMEKGVLECVLLPTHLEEVALEVCRFFEAKCKLHGVSLTQSLGGLPPVLGDRGRLRQVLINLISNSLKFTPRGGRIQLAGEQYREGGRRWVEVAVSDTGRGIDPEDRDRLFKVFSQGSNAQGEGAKGTGLGLYIVKSIVEQHGGRVEARSAPGQGTRLVFTLRVA